MSLTDDTMYFTALIQSNVEKRTVLLSDKRTDDLLTFQSTTRLDMRDTSRNLFKGRIRSGKSKPMLQDRGGKAKTVTTPKSTDYTSTKLEDTLNDVNNGSYTNITAINSNSAKVNSFVLFGINGSQ
jgi:hypothetical protein